MVALRAARVEGEVENENKLSTWMGFILYIIRGESIRTFPEKGQAYDQHGEHHWPKASDAMLVHIKKLLRTCPVSGAFLLDLEGGAFLQAEAAHAGNRV
jgi:hypothetical protein